MMSKDNDPIYNSQVNQQVNYALNGGTMPIFSNDKTSTTSIAPPFTPNLSLSYQSSYQVLNKSNLDPHDR
jgi:hypothetical protein